MVKKVISIIFILVISIIIFLNPVTAAGNQDYVGKIYNCNFPDLFAKYGELRLVQSHTQSSIQGKSLDTTTKEYVDIIVDILTTFNEVNTLAQSNEPKDHILSLEQASGIENKINDLKRYKTPNERGYPLLISIAKNRYYRTQAAYFQELAGKEKNSGLRIQYLENSALAYQSAGNLQLYSELSYKAEEEKQIYENDMKIASESEKNANTFFNEYDSASGSYSVSDFIYRINMFIEGNTAKGNMKVAIGAYRKHSSEELDDAVTTYNQIFDMNMDTFLRVSHYLLIISILYILISLYITFSIGRWTSDRKNADFGNELLEGLAIE